MNLTKDDLEAIKKIIDNAIEDSKRHTAAGFAEVHEKFAQIDEKFVRIDEKFVRIDENFARIEHKLDAVAHNQQIDSDRIDKHQEAFLGFKKALRAA